MFFQPIQAIAKLVGQVISVVNAEALFQPVESVPDVELVYAQVCLRLYFLQRGIVKDLVSPGSCLGMRFKKSAPSDRSIDTPLIRFLFLPTLLEMPVAASMSSSVRAPSCAA